MTINELMTSIEKLLPDASVFYDNDGQLCISTALYVHDSDDDLHSEPQESDEEES